MRLTTAQPTLLSSADSETGGKSILIGTVESTDTYLYATMWARPGPGPAPDCEVLGSNGTKDVLRRLSPGEAPPRDLAPNISLHPVYEFTEDMPWGRSWHIICERPEGTSHVYTLGPKIWPGTPADWVTALIISVIAIFAWGTVTGIATAIVRRH